MKRLVLLLLLLTACGGPGGQGGPTVTPTTSAQTHSIFAELARQLKPTVVNLQVAQALPPGHPALEEPYGPEDGQGSGVIIDSQGLILTNHHVVTRAQDIDVVLHDETRLPGRVIGSDASTDLALVQVETDRELPAARLGTSADLAVGDWVLAIGNPYGLEATVTVGVLSGTGRVLGAGPYDDFLQTDASINPGNSGGPLFDTKGEVVGINTAIIPGGSGLGFAIPIEMAREILPQLQSQGKVVRGFIGLGIQELSPRLREAFGVPPEVKGALVSSLMPGGPSERAGARLQDIVVEFDGKPVASHRALMRAVAGAKVGEESTLRVFREGRTVDLRVEIAERPAEETASEATPPPAPSQGLGLEVAPAPGGVMIRRVVAGSPASRADLVEGDLVRRVGSTPVSSPAEFAAAVKAARGETIALLVEREGSTIYVALAR